MNRYEIGLIITPEAGEDECKKITESILSTVKKSGANVENQSDWGLKRLAYPIKKQVEGYYVFLTVEGKGDIVGIVEKRLRQVEKVLRFIIFRLDDKLVKAHKLTKKWKKMEHFSRKPREAVKEAPEAEEPSAEESEEEGPNAAS